MGSQTSFLFNRMQSICCDSTGQSVRVGIFSYSTGNFSTLYEVPTPYQNAVPALSERRAASRLLGDAIPKVLDKTTCTINGFDINEAVTAWCARVDWSTLTSTSFSKEPTSQY